jgi:mRNA interferase MazF
MVNMPKSGEIIYIDFDPSAGAEIQKRRPAVVVSNNQLMATFPLGVVSISHGKFNGVRMV